MLSANHETAVHAMAKAFAQRLHTDAPGIDPV